MSEITTIQSDLITLKEIVDKEYLFEIPIYQRLYVWKQDQVKILLDDMYEAFESKQDIFYLGGVLVVKSHEDNEKNLFDLIDGQQRFTTLWMISMVFGHGLKEFTQVNTGTNFRHRVNFSIRTEVKDFFNAYMKDKKTDHSTISNITDALSIMETFTESGTKDIQGFSRFIYENIKLLFTAVPQATDLNKLFEIINNRGIQLQHHEILKAKLLNILPSEDRKKYSYLWDACSYMNNYVEKNIRDIANIKIAELYENSESKEGKEGLGKSKKILKKISVEHGEEHETLSLIEILSKKEDLSSEKDSDKDDEEYESDNNVRSIITFSMLLQHTLRLHLFRYYKFEEGEDEDIPKILDKELLALFGEYYFYEEIDAADVRAFIELLWEVRYIFDKHVIKWVETEEGEVHLINKLYKSKNKTKKKVYFTLTRQKPDSNDGCTLLQSMLYHSQQLTTHYWLTPYLNYLLDNKGKHDYDYLRHLDNNLLSGNDGDSLINRTHQFLVNPYRTTTIDYSILLKLEGTAFAHYWFYKLEFILWFLLKDSNDSKWKDFRFTAKNSVEHISPQTQKDNDTNIVSKMVLDTFGNLSLVSRSINSEYSNLPYNEKRQRFINKNRNELDSLKMALIYEHEHWNDTIAQEHQNIMLGYMDEYFTKEISFE